MQRSESYQYAVKITADKRIYEELKRGNVTIRYPNNCKRCKRQKKRDILSRKRKHPSRNQSEDSKALVRKQKSNRSFLSRDKNSNKYDTHCNITSPVNWQMSPLAQLSHEKSIENVPCKAEESKIDSDIENMICVEKLKREREDVANSMNNSWDSDSLESSITSKTPFIVVNIPSSTFATTLDTCGNVQTLNIDGASTASDGIRCRYCLAVKNESNDEENLISPCLCTGSSKFVHQSCLEKWLTLRDINECEICRTKYETKLIHHSLFSLRFPTMENKDVFLLVLTISFYVTLIFQFLGAVYVSIMADVLPAMVRIVTLFGLSLGLFWFMIGCITLTIVLYTSDYWRNYRYLNKRKVLVLRPKDEMHTEALLNERKMEEKRLDLQYDLSMAVPV